MPTVELTDSEYRAVQRMRMTPAERRAEAEQLRAANEQLRLARMTPEQRAEHDRIQAMTASERLAYHLVQQQDRIAKELEKLASADTRASEPPKAAEGMDGQ